MRIRSVLATIMLMAVPVLGFAAIIPAAPKLAAKSWVLMDAESGYVLTSSDADSACGGGVTPGVIARTSRDGV